MRTHARSFAGGEITPEAWGRTDLNKFQTGLALCRNFEIAPHGPVYARPGTIFGAEVKDSTRFTRLIPFTFNVTQTLQIEAGNLYFRFHVGGLPLLEANKAIVSIVGNLVTVTAHTWTTGDDIYIGGRPLRITVTGADTFTVADRWGNAVTPAGSVAARVYELATPYLEADLRQINFAQDADVMTLTHPSYAARELRRTGATSWALATISFAAPSGAPTGVGVVATTTGGTSNQTPYSYVVTAILADGVTETLASAAVTVNNNLTLAGNYNTVSWSALAGATRYYTYKKRGGLYGYIGQTTGLSVIDDNVQADTTKTPPESIISLNTGADDYPAAVSYYEQRRWFGGTNDKPQSVWCTRSGTESNLTSSIPSQSDDAMEFRLRSQQQNGIRHLVPLSDLIALTVGPEFRIFADGAPNITPGSLSTKTQGYSGSSTVAPQVASASLLYVQAQGARFRELAYNDSQGGFASIDISIMAPHLFDGYSIVDAAYARAPVPTLWAARSDGLLLGMTYVPEQQVYAWHQHSLGGGAIVESISVVSEGAEDVLTLVVRRTVNGRSVRYIERRSPKFFAALADAFFVDCGLTYVGAPTSTISGLWHLEGATVQVLTDGAVHPPLTVTGGSITLEAPASKVTIGLPYVSDMQLLPLVMELEAAGQGREKNINSVALRVAASTVFKAGPTFDTLDLVESPDRDVLDNFDQAPALRTGIVDIQLFPDWNQDGSVCIRRDTPLPLTILSLALDVAAGG